MMPRLLAALLLLPLLPATAAAAQTGPALGFAAGLSSVPDAFHPGCNGPSLMYPGVEGRWLRVPHRRVTREWRDGDVVRELSSVRDHRWWGGAGTRLGLEVGTR